MVMADRDCGDCNVCCWALIIDQLNKPSGVVCRHWSKEHHCTRYETRPADCRNFLCGWRLQPLSEEWRPDRCEIAIYCTEGGYQFELVGGLDRLFWRPFLAVVTDLLARNVPVYLSARAAAGYVPARVHLNDVPELQQAVAQHNISAFTAQLSRALQVSIDAPQKKVEFDTPH
jgi:hypothetical protein